MSRAEVLPNRDHKGALPLLALACFALTSCKMPGEQQDFSKLTDDFVYGSLALSPIDATSAGYHMHDGINLDDKLDNLTNEGIQEQRRFYFHFRDRLAAIKPETLSPEDSADYRIIQNQIDLTIFNLQRIQPHRHNPTMYVELVGNALFNPFVLEYAPLEDRYRHIIQRLFRIPSFLENAQSMLLDSPEIWNRVAQEENAGNIDLIDQTLRAKVPPPLKPEFDRAAKSALDALARFNKFLKTDLSRKTTDWRLGKDKYDEDFRYTLASGKTPDQVLAQAETALKEIRGEMAELAAPRSVKEALDKIAQQHATPETYFDDARKDLAEATDFVRSKNLVTLPGRSNLQVIPTPEFMRGGYPVGGFNQAPALEPQLGAFYWITPIPTDWPKDRMESKLREYNTYGLQELTIHEAMPGHYVQLEIANNVEPKSRRLLRNIYGNGAYVEGWGVYAQQLMSDEGYLNNSVELRLSLLKQLLRVAANAIIDIRFHTLGMTEQQALDLMINDTFQEKEEAEAKIQRAELGACQLPTYFVGWRGWLDLRESYKKRKGASYNLTEFHDAALKESAVPLPLLDPLLK
ncbi:MAG TPA: DUF885 domain-containing protein [Bryobacteraceae bacterium]|nr:DUF885 domain-containing protein [Bryobacteraceae bacterium]